MSRVAENDQTLKKFLIGKKIASAEINAVEIVLTFEDGSSFNCEPTFVGGFICEVHGPGEGEE